MKVLVTGASGLLGINLTLEAGEKHQVTGVVYRQEVSSTSFETIKTDLLKPGAVEEILDKTQPDWVIHCAALTNLEVCDREPELAEKSNTDLPKKLAKHVARGGARLIHVSTDAVFDGVRGNYSEIDDPNPLSTYSKTKLAGERAVLEEDPNAIIARVVLYGWSLTGKRSLAEWFFNNLSQGNRIKGFTDVWFCPLEATQLSALFLEMLELGLNGIYHVVSSECISKYEFGVRLANKFGFDPELITPSSIESGNLSTPRSKLLTLNNNKLTKILGRSLPGIQNGLDRFYDLYQAGYICQLRKLKK